LQKEKEELEQNSNKNKKKNPGPRLKQKSSKQLEILRHLPNQYKKYYLIMPIT
jgi:hypothetical protein